MEINWVWVVVGILTAVAIAVYFLLFLRNLSKTEDEVENFIKYLNTLKSKSDGNKNIYVENFEDIRKKVEQLSTVRDIWNDFEKSLVRVKDAETKKKYIPRRVRRSIFRFKILLKE